MIKLLLLLTGLLFSQLVSAQIHAGGELLDKAKAEQYIFVQSEVVRKKYYNFMIHCAGLKKHTKLTDAQGEPLAFDSLAAGFDYFYRQGWEFCSVITDVTDGPISSYHTFLFQRRK